MTRNIDERYNSTRCYYLPNISCEWIARGKVCLSKEKDFEDGRSLLVYKTIS